MLQHFNHMATFDHSDLSSRSKPSYCPVTYESQSGIREITHQGQFACLAENQTSFRGTTKASNNVEIGTSSRRRVPVACGRCRKRKIRCSGDPGDGSGCTACKSAGVGPGKCIFLRVSCETISILDHPQTVINPTTMINCGSVPLQANYAHSPSYNGQPSMSSAVVSASMDMSDLENSPSYILSNMSDSYQAIVPSRSLTPSLSANFQSISTTNFDNSGLSLLATNALSQPDLRSRSDDIHIYKSNPVVEQSRPSAPMNSTNEDTNVLEMAGNTFPSHSFIVPSAISPPTASVNYQSGQNWNHTIPDLPNAIHNDGLSLLAYSGQMIGALGMGYVSSNAYPQLPPNMGAGVFPTSETRFGDGDANIHSDLSSYTLNNPVNIDVATLSIKHRESVENLRLPTLNTTFTNDHFQSKESYPSMSNARSTTESISGPSRYAQYACANIVSTPSMDVYKPPSIVELTQPVLSFDRTTSISPATSTSASNELATTNITRKRLYNSPTSSTSPRSSASIESPRSLYRGTIPTSRAKSQSTNYGNTREKTKRLQSARQDAFNYTPPSSLPNRDKSRKTNNKGSLMRTSTTMPLCPSNSPSLLHLDYAEQSKRYYHNVQGRVLSGRC